MTKPRPISRLDVDNIGLAIAMAKQARYLLRSAGAVKAADAMTRTLKSMQGAFSHARGTFDHRALQAAAEQRHA